MSEDRKDHRPESIFAPRVSPEDDWRRLRDPGTGPSQPRRRKPFELILIVLCAGLAAVAGIWSLSRGDGEGAGGERAAPAIVTLVAVPEGETLQDVCAAYGLPAGLCDLSERCAARAPRRDRRVALVLRSDGEDCGSPPP